MRRFQQEGAPENIVGVGRGGYLMKYPVLLYTIKKYDDDFDGNFDNNEYNNDMTTDLGPLLLFGP